MGSSNEARIWGVIGASGTGKGLWAKQQLRKLKPGRLVCWDFMDEYGEFAPAVPTLEAVRQAMLKAGAAGNCRVRYVPRGAGEKQLRKEFEVLCELVYAWGSCTYIAEELANVTTPGWAPAAWRKMCTSGRHKAVHVIGFTQTPALVDKSFMGNLTLAHVCALREEPHRRAIAQKIDVDVSEVRSLPNLHYIERDFLRGTLEKGTVKVPGGAPTRRGRNGSTSGTAEPCQDTGADEPIEASAGNARRIPSNTLKRSKAK